MTIRRRTRDEWHDAFIAHARLRRVPGARIGEALAEVDTHCADSGERPADTFGDPVAYAEALASEFPPVPAGMRHLWAVAFMALTTLSGVLCLLVGLDGFRRGLNGSIHTGQLAAVVAGTLAIVVARSGALRRWRWRVGWPLFILAALGIGAMIYVLALVGFVVFIETVWGLFAAGLFLLALGWWPFAWLRRGAGRIVDPRTGTAEPPGPSRLRMATVRWSLPAGLFAVAAYLVLLPKESLPSW